MSSEHCPRDQQAVGQLRVLRPARVPPLRRGGRRAADDDLRGREAAARARRGLLQPPITGGVIQTRSRAGRQPPGGA